MDVCVIKSTGRRIMQNIPSFLDLSVGIDDLRRDSTKMTLVGRDYHSRSLNVRHSGKNSFVII